MKHILYNSIDEMPEGGLGNCVYIIELEKNIFKMGISIEPKKRLKALNNQFDGSIKRICIFPNLWEYDMFEKRFHEGLYSGVFKWVPYKGSMECYTYRDDFPDILLNLTKGTSLITEDSAMKSVNEPIFDTAWIVAKRAYAEFLFQMEEEFGLEEDTLYLQHYMNE